MAFVQWRCQTCQHVFYRIVVACSPETTEACPSCQSVDTRSVILPDPEGKTTISPCKHQGGCRCH